MATIKIQVRYIKENEAPISMINFIGAAEKVIEFLNQAGQDVELKLDASKWYAAKFKSSDPTYDIYHELGEEQIDKYSNMLERVMGCRFSIELLGNGINLETYKKYLEIAKPIGFRERISLGIYRGKAAKKPAKRFELDKERAESEFAKIDSIKAVKGEEGLKYHGEIQGIIWNWHKEGDKPHIEVKDFNTGKLVKCYYTDELYEDIFYLFEIRKNIVFVQGEIVIEHPGGLIEKMENVDTVSINKYAKIHRDGDLDKFFGCAPGLTKGLSAREYIERIRDE